MQSAILKKDRLDEFIKRLAKDQKVVAPVSKGYASFSFEEVTDSSNISIKHIPTILPPKKYFMPQYETLLEYDRTKGEGYAVVETEDTVLFGVHTCDIAGIQCLNTVFSDRPKDQNYLIKKKYITVIGIECNEYCDSFASCALMENHMPDGGYDLFFTDIGDEYFVKIKTYAGDSLLEKTKLFEPVEDIHGKKLSAVKEQKYKIFSKEVNIEIEEIPGIFSRSLDSPIWHDIGEKCLSCGNCTNVCPTCYCFDVLDVPEFDLKTGKRIRVWDSCQNERFAKVAGGESFRKKRADRKKHRFYRKFSYPVDRFGKFFCTGCGRCSRTCMAKINLKETLDQLVKEDSK